MTVEVLARHDSATSRVVELTVGALGAGATVLGLPTGRTMTGVYAALRSAPVDWAALTTFNVDEFASVSPHDPASLRAYMDEHLFRHVSLRPEAIGFLRGDTADHALECERYEAAVAASGGLDFLLLGIGENGHLGFNEPGASLRADTHVASLHESTRRASADAFGGDWQRVPARALTLGLRHLLGARRVVLMATGPSKAAAVAAMCQGPLTTACPASWLQLHRDATVVVDEDAATALAGTERGRGSA